MQQRRVPQSPSLGPSESPYSYSQPNSRHPSPYQPHAHTQRRSIYQPNSTAGGNRTDSALDEHSFINDTGNQLDAYIAQGQAILGNLGNQRDVLKGASTATSGRALTAGKANASGHWLTQAHSADCYRQPTRSASRGTQSTLSNGEGRGTWPFSSSAQ